MRADGPDITALGAPHSPGRPRLTRVCAIRAEIGSPTEFDTSRGVGRAMFPITGGVAVADGWRATILPGEFLPAAERYQLTGRLDRWVVAREGELGPPDASTSPHLDRSLDELELSVRTSVALHSAGLSTVRELCRMTEADLLRTKNLGRRSLKEIEEILLEMGLSLRMTDV